MTAIYPGSFDPVTNGHVNIVLRSAAIFSRVIIAVLDNPHKKPLFSASERICLLQEVFAKENKIPQACEIEIEAFSGLLVDYAAKKGIRTIIRGVRSSEDLAKELPYASWNRQLACGSVETIYLPADQSLAFISSSIVKEVAMHIYQGTQGDNKLAQMVPPVVCAALRGKYKKNSI